MNRFEDPDGPEVARSRPGLRRFRPFGFLSLVLAIIVVFLVFIIVSGTFWAFSHDAARSRGESRSLFAGGKGNPVPEDVIAADPAGKTAIFADIGTLRAATADKNVVTVVIMPFFPYPSDDVPFREELVQKSRTIRTFILDWFHVRTVKELGKLGEREVKAALIDGINSLLVLGKIDALYFSEYMVIE